MLKGLDPLLTPDLLHALGSMGHGDRIAVVDANFPAAALARRLVGLPGATAPDAVRAILTVLPLDDAVIEPAHCMQVIGDPDAVPEAMADFATVLGRLPGRLERQAFYDAAAGAFAIVRTGERRTYGNLLLIKGVVR